MIDNSNWSVAPAPRYDHSIWFFEEKIVLFGGRSDIAFYVDIWIYDICISTLILVTNSWEEVYVETDEDYHKVNSVAEGTSVFVPAEEGQFKIYLTGGVLIQERYAVFSF